MDSYKTITTKHQIEIVEKKSRFIGTVIPVTDASEANDRLSEIRNLYKDATHNCYAYSVGIVSELLKQSDDGEPAGTAGKPILDVIKNNYIRNVLIVVTRYFGGTLLGTGGLVHAYGKAAKDVVTDAGIVVLERKCRYEVVVDYNCYGKLQYEASKMDYQIDNTLFTDVVTCRITMAIKMEQRFCKTILDLTNAKVSLQKLDEVFLPVLP